jgi:transposase-like protein
VSAARKTTSRSEPRQGPRHYRRLSQSEKSALVEAYEAGWSYAEIERRFGVGHSTIARVTAGSCDRRGRKLSPDDEQRLIEQYREGAAYKQLARQFQISKNRVGFVLQAHGVSRRRGPSQRSERLGPEVVDQYKAGASQTELAGRFGFSLSTISRILDRSGVDRRSLYESHARKYAVNHKAFSDLTSESAYWAGFLMADGCVYGRARVQLTSHVRDEAHLKRFLRFVGSPSRPLIRRDAMATALVNSAEIVNDLGRQGVVPRKSYGARASEEIARIPSFWLGMIDGDGTIGAVRAPYISLCGSRPLLEQYTLFLADAVLDGHRQRITRRRPDGLCFVVVEGESARRLAELLYSSSPVCLPRKAKSARVVLAYRSQRTVDPHFSKDERRLWRQKRALWQGNAPPRGEHVAKWRSFVVSDVLDRHRISDARPWKPSKRSSMVAFEASVAGELAVIWVCARWKAEVPALVRAFAGDRRLFALHVSPAHPEFSYLNEIEKVAASVVPLAYLREMRSRVAA